MTNTSTATTDRRALLQSSLQALEVMEAKLASVERAKTEPIAIVGMSCRFPGADSVEQFWQLLRDGRDAVRDLPPERRRITDALGAPAPGEGGRPQWRGGFLDGLDMFDPQFFGITPREALTMDPQHRLALEVSWEALERAGLAPDRLNGSLSGVFLGISTNDYGSIVRRQGYENIDAYAATGGSMNVAAGRVSFTLGLQGPCIAVDTACSSSLVAIHLAVQSLRGRECNMALAGGVNAVLMPDGFISFSNWGMMAPDGRCKTFDSHADGFVRSEGCGIVVLKRLSDAVTDGDTVLAVIRGSSVNQDGRSSGLTVPNGLAQQAMLRQALANAGLAPAQMQYIEAHGTGTALGDPIEVEAIGAVLGQGRKLDQPLFLSSVKTNIGHPESAAGIAGVIKVVLAMQHGEIPPHLHLQERNPAIPWPSFPVDIPTVPTPWPLRDGQRIAGVSGFGFSGTNAHVILASPPEPGAVPSDAQPWPRHVLTLSAKNENALRETAGRLAQHLTQHPNLDPADVCYTLNNGRGQFMHRLATTGASTHQLAMHLADIASGEPEPGTVMGRAPAGSRPRIAFLFTGQGAQYSGMGRQLYEAQPAFRAALDQCVALLAPHLDQPLLDVMFDPDLSDVLNQTRYTQPALFALEYALAMLWRSWGVTPVAVLGHSVGEYVGAVLAGVMQLEDAAALIAARGRLMQSLPEGGAMAAIFAPEAQVQMAIAPDTATLAIAAINGPEHTVISGAAEAVDAVMEQFAAAGVRVQRLVVSHAFHSPLMAPILDDFERHVAGVALHAPRLPLISNLTGAVAGDDITTPAYWRRHVREAVRFGAGIEALRALGVDVLIEIGPHPTLLGMAQPHRSVPHALSATDETTTSLPSLRRGRDEWQVILDTVAALYVHGAAIDWSGLDAGARRRKLTLPTYAFQRSRYWVDLPLPALQNNGIPADAHPLLGRMSQSPLLKQTLFETQLSADSPPYLADHMVYGNTVFPGTAYLEIALAAAQAISNGVAPPSVATLSIREPLMLSEETATKVQVLLTSEEGGDTTLQVISFSPDAPDQWRTHATGTLRADAAPHNAPTTVELVALQAACSTPVNMDEYYHELIAMGLDYGPSFQGLVQLNSGSGAALGFVRLPEAAGSASSYQIHPALLDVCFHVIGAAMPTAQRDDPDAPVYVPVGMSGVRLYHAVPSALWCHVQLSPEATPGEPALACRVQLLDESGQVIAVIERLDLLQAPRANWGNKTDAWFHQIAWRAQPRAADAPAMKAGTWLIVADDPEAGDALAASLRARDNLCVVAVPGPVTARQGRSVWHFDPNDPRLIHTLREAAGPESVRGVIGLWTIPVATGSLDALWAGQRQACATALHLAQGLAEAGGAMPRLWLVTCGAQPVEGDGTLVEVAHASLWGLGRVIAQELPALHCTCIDLDRAATPDALVPLTDELLAPTTEDQIAFRGNTRYVARMIAHAPTPAVTSGQPYQLVLPERGALDRLALQPMEMRLPGPGEIAIEVHATGLNFRDVLNVLGMYPGDPGPPGLECAGVVIAVGDGVSGFHPGEAVVALAPRAFDAVAYTRADMAVLKPANVSFAEAVTVPSAFLTAYHGLRNLAKLQPGERVLIHAAAGGVGLAAVQIAQQIGVEVFATAGSPAKHAFLRSLGVQHIFSSRAPDFLDRVMALTNGHGVDVVLNSLSDDFITSSFAALAPRGRFLEIGKRGIWSAEQAAAARPDVMYAPFDLGDVLRDDSHTIQAMLSNVLASMATSDLTPLPLRAFAVEEIVDAFRFMAQAKHIGKVVVTHRPITWRGCVRPDGSYLVTGGLGGLGLRVAEWLVERGARHIALLGRSTASPEATAVIAALRDAGAEIQVIAADIGQRDDVVRALSSITPPLRGIIHAAGRLDDGVLAQQTWARFERVFAPKVAGAWNLHAATHGAALDFFVMFSSVSGLLGNPGQANYAAANAFLDGLAHARRAVGLPALSIDWGAWAEVGMAAKLNAAQQGRTASRGITPITPDQGVQALERALIAASPQVAILPVRWSALLRQFAGRARPPLLAELDRSGESVNRSSSVPADDIPAFRERFKQATPPERASILITRINQHLARVMGHSAAETPDPSRTLTELGLDSLMAVELKNRIDADLLTSLHVSALLQGPTIIELSEQLALAADNASTQPVTPSTPVNASAEPEQILAHVDELSDSDVDALLDEMLKEKGVS